MTLVRTIVYLPYDLRERLLDRARSENRKLSNLVVRLLNESVESEEHGQPPPIAAAPVAKQLPTVPAPVATAREPETNLAAFSPEVMRPKGTGGTLNGCREGIHMLRPNGHCRVCGIDPKNPPAPLPPNQANCKHMWQAANGGDGPADWCPRCGVDRDVARPGWRE